MKQWETVKMKLKELHPADYNPREISEKALAGLSNSIERFGLVQPIVWNKRTGNVVGGHQRMRVLQASGQIEADVVVVDLDSNEEVALNVALNNPEIQGDFSDSIAGILKSLSHSDMFSKLNMDDLAKSLKVSLEEYAAKGTEDNVPKPPKESVSVAGSMYGLGAHRLYCGDSSDKSAVERLFDGKKAVLVFTDPPYGVSIGKKNALLNEFKKGSHQRNTDDLEMDDMDSAELGGILLKIFTLWYDYMGDNCAVFVCFPLWRDYGPMMMGVLEKVGLKNKHILLWVKNSPTFTMGRLDYEYQHEPIYFTWKKTHKRKKAGQFQTTLWESDKPLASKEHPTMKPVELPVCAIMNHTDEGDIVADMFGGSGTTLIAAEKTKRIACVAEIEPSYCDVIRRRWAEYVYGEGCDWEKLTPRIEVKA